MVNTKMQMRWRKYVTATLEWKQKQVKCFNHLTEPTINTCHTVSQFHFFFLTAVASQDYSLYKSVTRCLHKKCCTVIAHAQCWQSIQLWRNSTRRALPDLAAIKMFWAKCNYDPLFSNFHLIKLKLLPGTSLTASANKDTWSKSSVTLKDVGWSDNNFRRN